MSIAKGRGKPGRGGRVEPKIQQVPTQSQTPTEKIAVYEVPSTTTYKGTIDSLEINTEIKNNKNVP